MAAHREAQEIESQGLSSARDGDHHEEVEYGRGYGHEDNNEHDRIPFLTDLTPRQRAGRNLYQRNCALCHAADGTGRNWIGSFLDPSPPTLADVAAAGRLDNRALRLAILNGLPNTSMPAFRNVLKTEEIDAIVAYVRRAFADEAR